MNQITKAKAFATAAHKGHTENDALGTPYVFHLQRVAALVQLSGGSEAEIAAAWLHDTVEDTDTTLEDIEREFGAEVAAIVDGLTDLPEWDSWSVVDKKQAQADKIAASSESVRRVKLADQISGGELDAKNELLSLEKRKQKLEGVYKVARACAGVSEELDELFEAVGEELGWYLERKSS